MSQPYVDSLSPAKIVCKSEFERTHLQYGYDGRIDAIYEAEFAERLKDACYLDYGGSGVYTSSHLLQTHTYLSRTLTLNPHTDIMTSNTIDSIRESVLSYFGTTSKSHSLIFTYNTSTALHLLASIFPFTGGSELCAMMDNHNSVLGMREKLKTVADGEGGRKPRFSVVRTREVDEVDVDRTSSTKQLKCCCSAPLHQQHSTSSSSSPATASSSGSKLNPCLFVFPGESNFDGRIYDLSLASTAKSYNYPLAAESQSTSNTAASTCASNPLNFHHIGPAYRWYTLVDASKLVCTSPLNLSSQEGGKDIDFVTISFYKMFGFPTGLAALIVKNETAKELWGIGGNPIRPKNSSNSAASSLPSPSPFPSLSSLRSFFSGGTVNAVLADEDFHEVRNSGKLHEILEDGTLAFTTIVSVPYGLTLFRTLQPHRIHEHTTALIQHAYERLKHLKYANGRKVCKFYGTRDRNASSQQPQFGPTLNLNFYDSSGTVIGYKTIEKIATTKKIFIRSGSFCNPGACQLYYPLLSSQIRSNLLAGYACWEDGENLNGVVNGSVRITLGWSSRWWDIERFVTFVEEEVMQIGMQSFVSKETSNNGHVSSEVSSQAVSTNDIPTPAITPFSFPLPSWFHDVPSTAVNQSKTHQLVESKSVTTTAAATTTAAVPTNTALVTASPSPSYPLPNSPYVLSELTVYPIKSCAGITLTHWFIHSSPHADNTSGSSSSLFLDREFVLLDAYGTALSQKTMPKLQTIRPELDLKRRKMILRAQEMEKECVVEMGEDGEEEEASVVDSSASSSALLCPLLVCGHSSIGYTYDTPRHRHVTEWLTQVVGKYTCLARKSRKLEWPESEERKEEDLKQDEKKSSSEKKSTLVAPVASNLRALTPTSTASITFPSPSPPPSTSPSSSPAPSSSAATPTASSIPPSSRASFANEDDFLLVNAASVREIEKRLHAYVAGHSVLRPVNVDASIPASRFRPNFVFDSASTPLLAFSEDSWSRVTIGPFTLSVVGGCGRCVMVNVDGKTGERSSALYALLNQCRKKDGKVLFGTLLSRLRHEEQNNSLAAAAHWWPIHVGMPCSAE